MFLTISVWVCQTRFQLKKIQDVLLPAGLQFDQYQIFLETNNFKIKYFVTFQKGQREIFCHCTRVLLFIFSIIKCP